MQATNLYELTVWLIGSMRMLGPKMSAVSPNPGGQATAMQQNFLFREVFISAEKPAIFLPCRWLRSGVKNAVQTSPGSTPSSDCLLLGLPR